MEGHEKRVSNQRSPQRPKTKARNSSSVLHHAKTHLYPPYKFNLQLNSSPSGGTLSLENTTISASESVTHRAVLSSASEWLRTALQAAAKLGSSDSALGHSAISMLGASSTGSQHRSEITDPTDCQHPTVLGSSSTEVRGVKRKHKCPECFKEFRVRCQMEDHYRTHTGEKPFKCPVCPRGYASKTAMRQHARRHGTSPIRGKRQTTDQPANLLTVGAQIGSSWFVLDLSLRRPPSSAEGDMSLESGIDKENPSSISHRPATLLDTKSSPKTSNHVQSLTPTADRRASQINASLTHKQS